MAGSAAYNAGLIGFQSVPPAPAPGPVTGIGTIKFLTPINDALAIPAGILPSDLVGTATWKAIGAAIELHVKANLTIVALGLTNPGNGGPIVGIAKIA